MKKVATFLGVIVSVFAILGVGGILGVYDRFIAPESQSASSVLPESNTISSKNEDWGLEKDVPSDAQIVGYKWTFTKETYQLGEWSDWQDSPVSESNTIEVKSQQTVASYTYKYSHWCKKDYSQSREIPASGCNTFHETTFNSPLQNAGVFQDYGDGGAKYSSKGIYTCPNGCYSWSNEEATPNYKTQWCFRTRTKTMTTEETQAQKNDYAFPYTDTETEKYSNTQKYVQYVK